MSEHRKHHGMYYVYRMRSVEDPEKEYIGTTSNVKGKLAQHNRGKIEETNAHKPWVVTFYAAFPHRSKAKSFSHYLKTESGHAFARKHLW
ncbi:MAG: GIY-YIG nuclease family protein [Verrucomicrobia bacterium]|nr:GIY-YIG nuclease family protein [Verrucomicrobiota bacterium]MCH8514403.1 GIY-YIG nuclease family protein [Kiritimatiellia bacterium]